MKIYVTTTQKAISQRIITAEDLVILASPRQARWTTWRPYGIGMVVSYVYGGFLKWGYFQSSSIEIKRFAIFLTICFGHPHSLKPPYEDMKQYRVEYDVLLL